MKNFNNQSFWAITSYFNPCNYQRRLDNYKIFRQFLNIPLVTVELSFNGNFQLTENDADILVQIKGYEHNIMWQKERLLNIALTYLPDECENVAWLDCDIIFEDENWYLKASELLKECKVIQLFKQVHHLAEDLDLNKIRLNKINDQHIILTENSFTFNLINEYSIKFYQGNRTQKNSFAHGVAWAGRKNFLNQIKFYDANIIGGGDSMFTRAYCQKHDPILQRMTQFHSQHYTEWITKLNSFNDNKINFLNVDLYHLWHGNFSNRDYINRHEKLKSLNFNPYTDLILDDNKCWKWNSDKPKLHQYVKDYFYSRKEDG